MFYRHSSRFRRKTTMRIIFVVVFGFLYTSLSAQKLLESRKSSHFTYIFKISDEEAERIYAKKKVEIDTDFFHTLIDSFPTDQEYTKKLSHGHYLKTYSDRNIQKTEIATVQNLEVFLLNNHHDLVVQLYDLNGNIVRDAKVKINNKSLSFNDGIEAFFHRKSNKKGLLKITYEGKTAFYYLDRSRNNSAFRRNARKVLYGIPIKYVWTPVEFAVKLPVDAVKSISDGWSQGTIRRSENFFVRIYHRVACLFDDYHCNLKTLNYKGYLVFNKPKFKPGDTVKFKSFIVNKRGKPYNKPISVFLYGNRQKTPLTTLNSYDKGGYEFQFPLHDSLNLRLDTPYTIQLENNKGNTLFSNSFRFEDYELAKNQLQVRLPRKNQYKDNPFEIYVKATDENELVLQDARVRILIRHKNPISYHKDHLFIPDTLGYIEKRLETTSETKIALSDSLFPPADFNYELIVNLLTSDNELLSKIEHIQYYHVNEKLDMELEGDSIKVIYKKNGLSTNQEIQVFGKDNFGNQTLVFEGETPAKFKLNLFYASYYSKSGEKELEYNISGKPALLQVSGSRTADSIKLEVYNPRNLSFNYTTYLKNKRLLSGYSNTLEISEPLSSIESYQISIQYIWGGKVAVENITIPLKDKALTIDVNQPKLVYPGQKSIVELSVTDFKGNPVEGVDITAYSMTKKFGYHPPRLPYLGKNRKNRNLINTFNLNNYKLNKAKERPIDYEYWNTLAGLDSIEYYNFIYPKKEIYQTSFTPPDSITQFAPFIFSDGKPVPIHVIYIDNKPVYFSWSTNERPYSFNIRPGVHQIRIRTANKSISIDSLYFPKNKKLLFSLDESILKENVEIKVAENKLSGQEQHQLYRYIFPYRNTFRNKFAFIQNDGHIQLLSPNRGYHYNNIVGPVSGTVVFRMLDGATNVFVHEPYFEYEFEGDLMKMRTYDKSLFPKNLSRYNRNNSIQDLVLTSEKIKNLYQNSIKTSRTTVDYFHNPNSTTPGHGRLLIEIEDEENLEEFPLNIFVFSQDNSDFIRTYSGNSRIFHELEEGKYKLIFFYPDKRYHIVDGIEIAVNGLNFLKVRKPEILKSDAFSLTLDEIIQNTIRSGVSNKKSRTKSQNQINATIQQYFHGENAMRIEGTLTDDTGLPLPGANVIIKGTTIGTQTDFDGNYSLLINPGDIVVFSYVGYETQEIVPRENRVDVELMPGGALEEVVVTGYTSSIIRQSVGYTVESSKISQLLEGKISGVMIGKPGAGSIVRIRGSGSLSADSGSGPLYIVNGMIYTGDVAEINYEHIISIQTLEGVEATSIYGSKGANGVVIIELNKELLSTLGLQDKGADFDDTFYESALDGSSLRQNFSDDAFWQPKLKTDENGKASFEVTFPDDITNWETFYLAMNGNKQTGQTRKSIKSYKPLMAQIALPRFLVAEDTTYAIGKTLNYTGAEQEATITYSVNDKVRFSKTERFENAVIDTLMITAKDSISVKYTLEKPDGYFDGELREIPVYPQGIFQTEGQFYVLENNEKIDLSFNPDYGSATLYARADILEVLDEEMEHVIRYRYLCNEQVASKLKMLLMQKKLAAYKNVPFKNKRKIDKHISLLLKNQKSSGLWGWWKDSKESYWISLHVLEALAMAKNDGYTVKLNTSNTIQEMIWKLEISTNFDETYRILRTLNLFDANLDYLHYIKKLEEKEDKSFNEQLLLTELQQTHGMAYQLDSIQKHKRTTLFKNVYFSDNKNISNTLNNTIQNTLLAYRILKADSLNHSADLTKMRNYFLERRQPGFWRNTFESAQIVEAILDDFMIEGKEPAKPTVKIAGDVSQVVREFPFELTVDPNQKIAIEKTGDFPVYFTSHQSYWESNPDKKSEEFEINTQFGKTNTTELKGGEEITLSVKVTIAKDAEYVLINVPIPGGCSYSVSQPKNRFESHRENFKNEATIFCENLPIGEHEFEVKLVPRYSGSYTLNPAKIEMMYFPTFNANNTLKKIKIK